MNTKEVHAWAQVCAFDEVPGPGARVVPLDSGDIAVFRCGDGSVFAVRNSCPHKQGPLSEGIVHGNHVTCPLHNWIIDLKSGKALSPDEGSVLVVPAKIEAGFIWLDLTAGRFAA